MSRGVQPLLVVGALRSEKNLVRHLWPQSLKWRETIPNVGEGGGEGIGFISYLTVFSWKHAVVIGQLVETDLVWQFQGFHGPHEIKKPQIELDRREVPIAFVFGVRERDRLGFGQTAVAAG